MALVYADRVKETSTTTGTGTLDLDGAVTGFQTFVAGIGDTNTCVYCIEAVDGNGVPTGDWETGIGTVTDATPDTLSRDTVLASSNSGSLVNFAAGTKNVFVTQAADRLLGLTFTTTTLLIAPERATATDIYVGQQAVASPVDLLFHGQDGSGTNIAGADLTLAGGKGTGAGAGGSVIIATAAAGASGSSQNALANAMEIDENGDVGIGIAPISNFKLYVNGDFRLATKNADSLRWTDWRVYENGSEVLVFAAQNSKPAVAYFHPADTGVGTSRISFLTVAGSIIGSFEASETDNTMSFSCTKENAHLIFETRADSGGNTERLRIRDSTAGQDNAEDIEFKNTNYVTIEDGHFRRSVTAGITASVTQTQGQGALVSDINEVSTCANTNDTVTLPGCTAGMTITVINNGAQTLQVFPASGDNLGAGVDTSTTITASSHKRFQSYDSTNWVDIT